MDFILSIIRHGLTTGGGFLASKGLLSQDDVTTAAGAVCTLVGLGFSFYKNWKARKAG